MTKAKNKHINRDIVVIGSSAGGLPALQELIASLPPDLDAAIFIVQHMPPYSSSNLHGILNRYGTLPVVVAQDGEKIAAGKVYVSSPDHHLLLENDKVLVKRGPKENRFRPSIDALFRSAAYNCGARVIGIVLSGALDDGTSGCWTINRLGGVTIAQHPDDAMFPQMSLNAQEHVDINYSIPAAQMGALLARLTNEPGSSKTEKLTSDEEKLLEAEILIASQENAFRLGIIGLGEPTPFTCPECHGALSQLKEGRLIRFRCHTGHAYTINALLSHVSTNVESILTQAMMNLEESTMLLTRLGEHFHAQQHDELADVFLKKANLVKKQSENIHASVLTQEIISGDLRYEVES